MFVSSPKNLKKWLLNPKIPKSDRNTRKTWRLTLKRRITPENPENTWKWPRILQKWLKTDKIGSSPKNLKKWLLTPKIPKSDQNMRKTMKLTLKHRIYPEIPENTWKWPRILQKWLKTDKMGSSPKNLKKWLLAPKIPKLG